MKRLQIDMLAETIEYLLCKEGIDSERTVNTSKNRLQIKTFP